MNTIIAILMILLALCGIAAFMGLLLMLSRQDERQDELERELRKLWGLYEGINNRLLHK